MREHFEELFLAFVRGMTRLEIDPASMETEAVLKRMVLYFSFVGIMLWYLDSPTTRTLYSVSITLALGSLIFFSLWNGFRAVGKKVTEIMESLRPPLI